MKRFRLHELGDIAEGHILKEILPGAYLSSGGLSFSERGSRSHSYDGPDGSDYHVHNDCEAFIILQGKGEMEIKSISYPVKTGDVIIVEPGEDHHLISSIADPIVTVWCHAAMHRHKNQQQ